MKWFVCILTWVWLPALCTVGGFALGMLLSLVATPIGGIVALAIFVGVPLFGAASLGRAIVNDWNKWR